ncbi:hypothetical protein V8E55_008093 [Tylopilus felleus]
MQASRLIVIFLAKICSVAGVLIHASHWQFESFIDSVQTVKDKLISSAVRDYANQPSATDRPLSKFSLIVSFFTSDVDPELQNLAYLGSSRLPHRITTLLTKGHFWSSERASVFGLKETWTGRGISALFPGIPCSAPLGQRPEGSGSLKLCPISHLVPERMFPMGKQDEIAFEAHCVTRQDETEAGHVSMTAHVGGYLDHRVVI